MGALTSIVLYLELTIAFDWDTQNRTTVQISREKDLICYEFWTYSVVLVLV